MKIAWIALSTLLGAALPAAAQPVTQPSDVATDGLGVDVLAPHAEVDAAEVRAAIGAELGIRVTDASAFAPRLGRLEILVDEGELRIAYHPAAGTVIERVLALPIEPAERVQMIAYIATNLVRDQASELLDALQPAVPVIPPPPAPPVRRPSAPPARHLPATIGFVPPVAVDRAYGERVYVGFGLHALVGSTSGSQYASISGLVDIQHDFAHGAQIGGIAAISRGEVDGVQLGGVAAVARGRVHGVQIGGVAAVANRVEGVQIGGVATVGGDVRGVQLGVINVARRMRGVQLGVVNVSGDGDDAIPIGLVNYARNGRIAAEGWVETSQLSALALRHGTRYVHNVWSVGWSPDYEHVLVGAGLGVHAPLTRNASFDLDALHWFTNVWNSELSQLSQLRASVAIPLGGVELFGGAAANVYVSDEMDESASFHPVFARRTTTSGGRAVVAWPTAFVGVRLAR